MKTHTDPDKVWTVEEAEKKLADLEAEYKQRRRTLRAFIAALKAEQGKTDDTPSEAEG